MVFGVCQAPYCSRWGTCNIWDRQLCGLGTGSYAAKTKVQSDPPLPLERQNASCSFPKHGRIGISVCRYNTISDSHDIFSAQYQYSKNKTKNKYSERSIFESVDFARICNFIDLRVPLLRKSAALRFINCFFIQIECIISGDTFLEIWV